MGLTNRRTKRCCERLRRNRRILLLLALFATVASLVLTCAEPFCLASNPETSVPVVPAQPKKITRPSRARVGSIPESITWTAQSLEDEHAWNTYFYGLRGGVVMESGAADGRLFSTTLAYESLDWRCVHIEVSPISFKLLVDNRPYSTNINAALCDERRLVHLVDAPLGPFDVVAGIFEFMTPEFVEHFHSKLARNPELVAELPVIECLPLVPLLEERANLTSLQIDFWVLDTEGSELAVLRTVDWNEITIDVIVIEVSEDAPPEKGEALKELLGNVGYVFDGVVQQNHWFRREGFIPHQNPRLYHENVNITSQT